MYAHLRFDLKSLGEHRKCLHVAVTECAIPGHDVLYIVLEEEIYAGPDDRVSEIVERTLIFLEVGRGEPIADDHIRIMVQYSVHHFRSIFRRICVITVNDQVALCIDLAEHSPQDISLSLLILMPDNSSRRLCDLRSPVLRVVVIHINDSLRKNLSEIPDNLFNCLLFVVAWNKHCYFIHCLILLIRL